MSDAAPIRVLFVCIGNSARSQMAEAILGHVGGPDFDVHSAGTHPGGVNPLTIRALAEIGIDWSGARSKSVTEYLDQPFDYVITVCDQAREACPVFPGCARVAPLGIRRPGGGRGHRRRATRRLPARAGRDQPPVEGSTSAARREA